jgi:cobalt-zinc-cadmium efflux system membrane fusion protein
MISRRFFIVFTVIALGLVAGSLVPKVRNVIDPALASVLSTRTAQPRNPDAAGQNNEVRVAKSATAESNNPSRNIESQASTADLVKMSPEQIAAAQIETASVASGVLAKRLTVPATVVPNSDHIARVPAKIAGTVAQLRKRLGDLVQKGEVVAVLDSREIADAKSEYLRASVDLDLQKTMFERAQTLWDKRISAEQQYLQTRATFTGAQLRLDLARQKLSALGLDATEVAVAAKQDGRGDHTSSLRQYELHSPIGGRVVERKVDVGMAVGSEGDPSDLYTIADLSSVWLELAVPTAELDLVREGQRVEISSDAKKGTGIIRFVSPLLDKDTRSARVVAEIDNNKGVWRPGSFVTAAILVDEHPVDLQVPRSAIQTIEGKPVVFARVDDGFEKREVTLGEQSDQAVEVKKGLSVGETIVTGNTFLLKAELGKAEAASED